MTNEATRAYVYRIALAALVLLAVYGVVDRDLPPISRNRPGPVVVSG